MASIATYYDTTIFMDYIVRGSIVDDGPVGHILLTKAVSTLHTRLLILIHKLGVR